MANSELSIRAYAATVGCSHTAVNLAIKDKKIVAGFNASTGKIVPDVADQEWGNVYKSGKKKPGVSKAKRGEKVESKAAQLSSGKGGKSSEVSKTPAAAKKSNKQLSTDLGSETDKADEMEGVATKGIAIPHNLSLQEAVRRREVLAARSDKTKLMLLEGSLVDKAEVDKELFAYGREIRNNMQGIPARIVDLVRAASTTIEAQNLMRKEIDAVLLKFSEEDPS